MTFSKELRMTLTFIMQRKNLIALVPFGFMAVGWKLDTMEIERMSLFRDNSALFGRERGIDYKPSWP